MAKLDTVKSVLAQTRSMAASRGSPSYRHGYNPLLDTGQDPWVVKYQGKYYYCSVDAAAHGIEVTVSSSLYAFSTAALIMRWRPHSARYARDIWAPELHHIEGKWYIYFAADDGNNAHHRMYVLEAPAPAGPWRLRGRIAPPHPRWAIDGTVLTIRHQLYFVWSGWHTMHNTHQCLFIASMGNPWTINGNPTCISHPTFSWEGQINEGPEALYHDGKIFIVYSANKSYSDKYCLGQLAYRGGNPLSPYAWRKKEYPVFHASDRVFGPGHASFTTSLHAHRSWMVYHAERFSHSGWNREIRAKPFTWNKDGSPHFGTPT